MPYMDTVQGRGPIPCTDITLLVLAGIEGTNAVIVTVTDCESHKLHLQMQFKELFALNNKVAETGWTNNYLFYSNCESKSIE